MKHDKRSAEEVLKQLPYLSSRRRQAAMRNLHADLPFVFYCRYREDPGQFAFATESCRILAGTSSEELECEGGLTFYDLIDPEDRDKVTESIAACLLEDRRFRIRYRMRRKDGALRYIIDQGHGLGKDGCLIEGVMFDITDQIEKDNELRDNTERFRALMEASFEGIAIHDQGKIIEANPAFARMFEYKPDEVIGMQVLDIVADENKDLLRQRMLTEDLRRFEANGLTKSGKRIVGEIRGRSVSFRGKKVRVVAVKDITLLKEAERALREANRILEERVQERTLQLQEHKDRLAKRNEELNRELELARQVQESLLPGASFRHGLLSIAACYQPAMQVGGDVYHILGLADERIAILLADVTGHGMSAALSTVFVSAAFARIARNGRQDSSRTSCVEILVEMNAELKRGLPEDIYASALVCVVDPKTGKTELASAGIPNPILLRADGRKDCLDLRGPLLGLFEVDDYSIPVPLSISLEAGDSLLLFTDGLSEMRNENGEHFATELLCDLLGKVQGQSTRMVLDDLVSAANRFADPRAIQDDLTALLVRWLRPSDAS